MAPATLGSPLQTNQAAEAPKTEAEEVAEPPNVMEMAPEATGTLTFSLTML